MNQINYPLFVLSKHATYRAQQRGIRMENIHQIWMYGRQYHAGSGVTAFHIGRREVMVAQSVGVRLDRLCNLAMLVKIGEDQTLVVITVQHSPTIPKHWRPARKVRFQ